MTDSSDGFLPVGTPIDLDNCAREPIHIPGSIQPRGALLVVRGPDLTVSQASANLPEFLGIEAGAAIDQPLPALLGVDAAAAIAGASSSFRDLRERNPVSIIVDLDGRRVGFDAILNRSDDGPLLVELEPVDGPRPFSFENTYLHVRASLSELNRAATLAELFDATAVAVRELTGFDRVMVYRYDADYNGEVVAEAKRDDLNSFLGLHYPSTDIPAQARALYEKNWIRLISDVDYTPVPIVPTGDPVTGRPLDLTYSTLRSVSPIHVEYLQNMGVHASMSISLLRDGRLWGLIACHHYAGPHVPPYGVRAAAEFLGSALSIRLVDRYEDDDLRDRLSTQALLTKLTSGALDGETVSERLLGGPSLLDLVPADGVVVQFTDDFATLGTTPDEQRAREIAAWALSDGDDVVTSDSLARDVPSIDVDPQQASGALVITLPDDQFILWTRTEVEQSVDWGGDPHNKAIAVQEGDGVRLSPRRSFERWRETVRGRSLPWTLFQQDIALDLRRHVVEMLYERARGEVRMAEALQRSLLPPLPALTDWSLSAHYEPAAGGRIGGDWYDAFELRDGRLALVVGDVAGHGTGAAGTMAQLRNALRAYLSDGLAPEESMARLNRFVADLMPGAFATVAVAVVDLGSGAASIVLAGHPPPYLVSVGDSARLVDMHTSPPLGVVSADYRAGELVLDRGQGIVLYSDGLIERREEDLEIGLQRLGTVLDRLRAGAVADLVFTETTQSVGTPDDATVVALHRPMA